MPVIINYTHYATLTELLFSLTFLQVIFNRVNCLPRCARKWICLQRSRGLRTHTLSLSLSRLHFVSLVVAIVEIVGSFDLLSMVRGRSIFLSSSRWLEYKRARSKRKIAFQVSRAGGVTNYSTIRFSIDS